ncbi:MAG: hypothetical protein R6W91_02630 [Thermoplasmata archaeon]
MVRVVDNGYDDSDDYDDSFEFDYCVKCVKLVHSNKAQCFHCGSSVAFPEEPALADLVRNITAISQSLFCTVCGTITAPRKVTEQRKAGLLTSRTETVESTVCSHCGREYDFNETLGAGGSWAFANNDADVAVECGAVFPIFEWDKPTKTWTGQLVSMRALRDAAFQRVIPDAPDKAKAIFEEFIFWEIKFTLKHTKLKEEDLRKSHIFWKFIYEGNLWGAAQAAPLRSNSVTPETIQRSLLFKGYGDRSAHLRFMSESFQALGVLERVNNYLSHKLGTNDLSEIIYGDEFFHDAQFRQRFLDMVGVVATQDFAPVPQHLPQPTQGGAPIPSVANEQGGGGERKPRQRQWNYKIEDYVEVSDVNVSVTKGYVDYYKMLAGVQKKNPDGTYAQTSVQTKQEMLGKTLLTEKRQLCFIDHRTKTTWHWFGAKCYMPPKRNVFFLAARQWELNRDQNKQANVCYLEQKSKPWLADTRGYDLRMIIQGEEPVEFWSLFDVDIPLPTCIPCDEILRLDKEKKIWHCPKCNLQNFHFPLSASSQPSNHQHVLVSIGAINVPGEPPKNAYECSICHERFIP